MEEALWYWLGRAWCNREVASFELEYKVQALLDTTTARVDGAKAAALCARLRRILIKGYKSRTLDFPEFLDTETKRLDDAFDSLEELAADAGDYTPVVTTGFLDLDDARAAFAPYQAAARTFLAARAATRGDAAPPRDAGLPDAPRDLVLPLEALFDLDGDEVIVRPDADPLAALVPAVSTGGSRKRRAADTRLGVHDVADELRESTRRLREAGADVAEAMRERAAAEAERDRDKGE